MEYANWPGLSHISTLTLWWIQSHMGLALRGYGRGYRRFPRGCHGANKNSSVCSLRFAVNILFLVKVQKVASLVVSHCQCRRRKGRGFDPWVRKIPWKRKQQPHSSMFAWKIPWTEEPGGNSPCDHRVIHN